MADSVQLEMSPDVLVAVDKVMHMALLLTRHVIPQKRQSTNQEVGASFVEHSGSSSSRLNVNVHFQCTNFNLFLSCDNTGKYYSTLIFHAWSKQLF